MRITEAARKLGVSASMIRRVEREAGIQIPRDRSGQRRFDEKDVEELRHVLFPGAREEILTRNVSTDV